MCIYRDCAHTWLVYLPHISCVAVVSKKSGAPLGLMCGAFNIQVVLASCRSELAGDRTEVTIRSVFVLSREQRGNMSVVDALGPGSADSKSVSPEATGFDMAEQGIADPSEVGLEFRVCM
jgi:hypothetical protein